MLTYRVVSRKNPLDQSVKYYAQTVSNEPIGIEALSKRISESCTVNPADVMAVLVALETQLIYNLQEGKSVRFGNVGSFHVTLNSQGVDLKENFTVAHIKRVLVRFIPSSKLRKALQPQMNSEVKFSRAKVFVEKPSGGGDGDGGGSLI